MALETSNELQLAYDTGFKHGKWEASYGPPPKPRGQSHKMSLTEAAVNMFLGYGVAVGAQVLVFPLFGINIPLHSNIEIGLVFMAISLVRQYVFRRFFNWVHHR